MKSNLNMLLLLYFLQVLTFIYGEKSQTDSKEILGHIFSESLNTTDLEPSDKTLLFHDSTFPKENFESEMFSKDSDDTNKFSNLNTKGNFAATKLTLLEKLNPVNILKPIHEKIVKVKESFVHPNNPGYGGIQGWRPDHIWDKIHATGSHFLSGINGAIFGMTYPQNNDYPFPYRMTQTS